MAALTDKRDTKQRGAGAVPAQSRVPVLASTLLHQGSLVAVDTAGFLVPGATATTLRAAGRSADRVDNSAGGNGDEIARVDHGIFRWLNSGGDPITVADRYLTCFIEDDQTVSRTDSSQSAAGIVIDVDADGVWVQMFPGQV